MKRIIQNNLELVTILSLIILILVPFVISLQFNSGPTINFGGTVRTEDSVNCLWQTGGDEILPSNVTWYKDGIAMLNQSSSSGIVTLGSDNTSKNDNWICEVFLANATQEISSNTSITIANTLPKNIDLHNGTHIIFDTSEIIEDKVYTFFINATDPDGDDMTYGVQSPTMCVLVDADTGQITCSPTHAHVAGSSSPAVEPTSTIVQIEPSAGDGSGSSSPVFNFTVVAVNDQAKFVQNASNQTLSADIPWVLILNGTDEELDYNLMFNMYSDINDVFSNTLILQQVGTNQANISFNASNSAPRNIHVGNWTVYVNVTDVDGSNSSREPDQMVFSIGIISTNHYPQFTSNLSQINGTQSLNFESFIFANDSDPGDNLTFEMNSIAGYSDNCLSGFPWNITTLDANASNATGLINVTITNAHVACRYVNITVKDDTDVKSAIVQFINLTNVNDAPEFSELGINGNVSFQETYLFVAFSHQVNASDIDNYTYDRANTAVLTYSVNESSPILIDSSTGLLTSTFSNENHTGNWTINITVSDGEYSQSRLMYLTVLNNSAPIINLSTNNISFFQNETVSINFSGSELNNDSMRIEIENLTNFNVSLYTITLISNNYSKGYNETFWRFNIPWASDREANDHVGNHLISISLNDSFNASTQGISTGIINITILNTNDVPFFDGNEDNFSDSITLGTVVQNTSYSGIIYATDFDLFVNSSGENLTFSYTYPSVELINISISKIDSNSAQLSFFPTLNGSQSIVVTVTDTNNSYSTQNVTFTVLKASEEPVLLEVKPYYNNTINQTIFSFANSSLFPTGIVNINVSENYTVTFDAIIANDSTVLNNTLSYYWYVDELLNSTIVNATQGLNSSLNVSFGFFSEGIHNITLIAQDIRLSSVNFSWQVNVTNFNREPQYLGGFTELTVNFSTTFVNFFSYRGAVQRFYDADEDLNSDGIRTADLGENTSLIYGVGNANECSFATFSAVGDDLTIIPTATGICLIYFNASDPYNASVLSEYVTINFVGGQITSESDTEASSSGGSSTRTQVITVPYEEEVDVPTPLTIVAPKTVDVYVNRTIRIPIVLRNDWTESLKGVSLNATIEDQDNVTYSFSKDYFAEIAREQEVETILSVTNYRTEGPFEIIVNAKVSDPPFVDSASIFINSLEQTSEGEAVKTKVTFARDMISENPECRELNDLLDRAQRAIDSVNYAEALNMVNAVINGCKFLINEKEVVRKEKPTVMEVAFDFMAENADKIAITAGLLTVFTILAYAIMGVKKLIDDANRRNLKDAEIAKNNSRK